MLIFYCVIESFFSIFALMRLTQMQTTNPITCILFCIFLYMYHKFSEISVQTKIEPNDHLHAGILSAVFTFFTVLATYEKLTVGISSSLFCFLILLGSIIGFALLYHHIVLWLYIKTVNVSLCNTLYPVTCLPYVTFILCMIAWLPAFLFEYPGVLLPDGINQLQQAVGVWELTNHHSVLYTLLIAFFYGTGLSIFKNPYAAIACFSVFQMLFMAFVAGYVIRTLQLAKTRTYICVIALCFYAFMPYQGALASTVLKDVMFTGSFTLYIASLLRIILENSREKVTFSKLLTIYLPHFIAGVFLSLLRSNGLFVFLLSLPFVLFVLREKWKKVIPVELLILLLVLFIRFPCMEIYHIPQADTTEALSIPLQQIARVLSNGESLTETQYDTLSHFMDPAQAALVYQSDVSDPIKALVRTTSVDYMSSHKHEFISLWFSIGLKHPKAYLDGYIAQTYGYWYPDAYSDVGMADGIFTNDLGLSWNPVLHGAFFVKCKEILFKLQTLIPLYGLLWSVGFAFWLILLSISVCNRRNNASMAILAIPSLLLVLSLCIATPVAVEFRYAYPLIHGLPIYLCMPFISFEEKS